MRDSIIVSVSELRSLVQDVRRSGKPFVRLSILDPLDDEDGGDSVPAELSLSAFDPDDSEMCIDFKTIYAPENESELSKQIALSAHMSSNLV
ncbi:MAG: hypothetical protein LBM69_07200 [Lachnospiraceae bacterium]|nr:hypothetical protein [Lachnospiraceae bacterium]